MKIFSAEEKYELAERYYNGETVINICNELGIARSTFYTWLKPYRRTYTEAGHAVSAEEFVKMKSHVKKLEQMIEVLKKVDCTLSAPLQEKLYALEPLYGQYSVHVLCEALDVSRGTFYNHIKRNLKNGTTYAKRREDLSVLIAEIYHDSNQIFGANKVRVILSAKGYAVSDKMVAELMREMGLYSIRTKAKRDYGRLNQLNKKANVLQRNFNADTPNKVWVSDVTCFKFKEKYFYICAIIDLFSRKVIAYKISLQQSTRLITDTFKKAYTERNVHNDLVFHSDRGSQYTAHAFQRLLIKLNVKQSFSNPGKPHDNAVAESFFASLKQEELYRANYKSEAELRKRIDAYMVFYNSKRPHTSIKYKTPDKMEELYLQSKDLKENGNRHGGSEVVL